jgi:hypothetical protein
MQNQVTEEDRLRCLWILNTAHKRQLDILN